MDLPDLTGKQTAYFGSLMEKCAVNAEIAVKIAANAAAQEKPDEKKAEVPNEAAALPNLTIKQAAYFGRLMDRCVVAADNDLAELAKEATLNPRIMPGAIGAAGGAGAGLLTNYMLGLQHPLLSAGIGAGLGGGAGAMSPEIMALLQQLQTQLQARKMRGAAATASDDTAVANKTMTDQAKVDAADETKRQTDLAAQTDKMQRSKEESGRKPELMEPELHRKRDVEQEGLGEKPE